MGFTAFIDVAIGLIVVYLAASLMVTVVNEWISQALKWRNEILAQSLQHLFNGQGFDDALKQFPRLSLVTEMLNTEGSKVDPYILARGIATALDDGSATGKASLDAVRVGMAKLPNARATRALKALAATCADDMETFIAKAGEWIDHTLTDLGHAYRARMQRLSFLLGLVIAVGCNIDTLHLVDRLYSDKALRDQVVATADGLVSGVKQERLQGCAAEWANDRTSVSDACAPVARLLDATASRPQAGQSALPIGWTDGLKLNHNPDESLLIAGLLSLIGWLLTAVGISCGTPFWFDQLGKLLNLRRVVAPPQAAAPK
jgi:hypothetical protein